MSAVGFEGVFQQGSAFLAQPRDIIGDVVIRQMVEQNVDLLLALLRMCAKVLTRSCQVG
jgi:hypothetical protein